MKPLPLLLLVLALVLVLIPATFILGSVFDVGPAAESYGARAAAKSSDGVAGLDADLVAPRSAAERRALEAQLDAALPTADAPAAPAARFLPGKVQRRAKAEKLIREQTLARARNLADQVGIDADGEKALAGILIAQRTRYQDLGNNLSRLPRAERKAALRAGNRELLSWYRKELGSHFDADVVEKIQKPYAKTGNAMARSEGEK